MYIRKWREDERLECDEERRRTRCPWADDEMDIDVEGEVADAASDESDEDESEEIKILKSKRRKLLSLLRSGNTPSSAPVSSARARLRRVTRTSPSMPTSFCVISGFSVLVIGTSILLSSFSIFASLVESLCWTNLVPLAVITELDGITTNNLTLGEAVTAAVEYISSHMRSRSRSLVQMSKGNYLQTLSIPNEQVEFA